MNSVQAIGFVIMVGGAMLSLLLGVIMHRKITLIIGSIFLMAVGMIITLGYITGTPDIYTIPPHGTNMSLLAGICFFVTGALILILTLEMDFKIKK